MKLKSILQKLEKQKIITKKPNPIYPFLLAIIAFTIWYLTPISLLKNFSLGLTIFTFIFAILHWVVVRVLQN
jgi:hypothetical protein